MHRINRIILLGRRRDGQYRHLADQTLQREIVVTIQLPDPLSPIDDRAEIHALASRTVDYHARHYDEFYVRTQFVAASGEVHYHGSDEALLAPGGPAAPAASLAPVVSGASA